MDDLIAPLGIVVVTNKSDDFKVDPDIRIEN
jgi:hypothetical protein